MTFFRVACLRSRVANCELFIHKERDPLVRACSDIVLGFIMVHRLDTPMASFGQHLTQFGPHSSRR